MMGGKWRRESVIKIDYRIFFVLSFGDEYGLGGFI